MAARTIPPSEASARQQALALAFETAKQQRPSGIQASEVLQFAEQYLKFLSPTQEASDGAA